MFTAKHFIYWLVHQLVRCLVDHVGNFDQVTLFIYLFCSIFPSSVALNTAIFLTSLCHSCINTVILNRETWWHNPEDTVWPLITTQWHRVILQRVTVVQLVKNFPFNIIQTLITVLTVKKLVPVLTHINQIQTRFTKIHRVITLPY